MAIHTQLPIYTQAYHLLEVITKLTKNLPRDFKQLVGAKLRDEIFNICILIFRANVNRDKLPHINSLIERLQVAELTIRLARDMRMISIPQYAEVIEITTSIGKQATGWRNSQQRPLHGS